MAAPLPAEPAGSGGTLAYDVSAEEPASAPRRRMRVESVDVLRGVIMILMAIDHTRDYFGAPVNPTDLATTTVPLFFTRWITHFCAPVFFLLVGTGARLALRRRTVGDLSRFLFTRGLWLVVLEVTVMRSLAWQFNFDYKLTVLTVLWALGWSMIVLSALVHLPLRVTTGVGIVLIAAHNLLDGVSAPALGALAPLWTVLHAPGVLLSANGHVVFAAYVLIPWIGVTAVGYGLGEIYSWDAARRRRFLTRLGVSLITAFVLLRFANVYGDPSRWSVQRSATFTLLSFIDTTKYPPSLLFLLMTLGPAMLFLRAMDGGMPRVLRPALIIGKVPMFYYVLHVAVIHVIAVIVCYVRYGAVHWMFESPDLGHYPVTQPPGWPLPLAGVYLVWAIVVMVLYPLCRWYAGVKQRRTDAWLSYL